MLRPNKKEDLGPKNLKARIPEDPCVNISHSEFFHTP